MSLLFKNYSPVEATYLFWLDSIRLSYSKESHRILIEMVQINKIVILVIMKISDTAFLHTTSYFTNISLSIILWESIVEFQAKLNRFWIDRLLSFTIGMTYMSMQQSCCSLKVVSAVIVLVCFLSLNESTFQTRKMFFIWLQKLFPFSRKSNFRILHFQISWRHQMPKHKTRNAFHWITWKVNTVC